MGNIIFPREMLKNVFVEYNVIIIIMIQLGKSDGIWGFQFGNQRLETEVRPAFRF